MPKYFKQSAGRLARQQRKLSRKTGSRKGETKSKNYRKQQNKVNRIYKHTANQRKDFLHKLSAAITKQYDVVCVEDLNVKAMSNKGFRNGRSTMDNGWGMFLSMLAYKLEERGKVLVKISRWYPSSQICSCIMQPSTSSGRVCVFLDWYADMIYDGTVDFGRAGPARMYACGNRVRHVSRRIYAVVEEAGSSHFNTFLKGKWE